jgi:Transcriptional Coactivator p15 (PC4)
VNQIVGHFQKSKSASIQVSLVEWQDATYLDIREVVPSDQSGEQFIMTKKGVRFRADLAANLIDLLRELDRDEG